MVADFKKCPNGHFYKGEGPCPFCLRNDSKMNEGMIWTSISENASDLWENPNVILKFDTAPDGLKRYVEIKRKYDDLYLKGNLSRMIGCNEDDLPEEFDLKVEEIDKMMMKELLKKNIFSLNSPERLVPGNYYVPERSISEIVPQTLLSQILGNGSKLDLLYRGNDYGRSGALSRRAINTAATASYGDEDFQATRKEIESKKYLSISLNDNSKNVICISDRNQDFCVKSIEEYISEDISILQPQVVIKEYGVQERVIDYEANSYSEIMAKIANNNGQSVSFMVSRQRIAIVLATMFEKLSELHRKGFVHCDLKPQNILCLKDGLMPFDAIKVRKGKVSAGMTANYCAPEQILTQPVSPATDIFNLGLIILSVIDGIVYGKMSAYVIPIGKGRVNEVRLLTEPMIYIDYEFSNVENKDGIVFWKSFLEKCLAFDPKNRFTDMESFANEYKRLIELYPLSNYIEFSPHFGNLSLVNHNGDFNAAWFIYA
ncbi:MAG: hypothetical protein IKX35_08815 [Bacteroidales bacterium]|nr:hypothetical protein [Bacteroidales bacterium]